MKFDKDKTYFFTSAAISSVAVYNERYIIAMIKVWNINYLSFFKPITESAHSLCIHDYSHSLPLCLLVYTNITITIIIIIIISNTIPPIAPAITGTAPEPVAVAVVTVLVMMVVIVGGVDVFIVDDVGIVPVNETSIEECNELV